MLVELSVVEQRYHAVMEVISGGVPVVEVAERYGVARKTVHAWLRRYRQDGLPGLTDRSHRPHHHPGQLAAEVEARVCELRRAHPRWGPRRLVHELRRLGVAPVPSRSHDLSSPFLSGRPLHRRLGPPTFGLFDSFSKVEKVRSSQSAVRARRDAAGPAWGRGIA